MKTIFTNDPPDFTKQEAAEQIQRVFHKKGELQELYSDRDQNFLFTTKNQKYLLKIYNSLEKRKVIEFQIASLKHIVKSDFPFKVPEPINGLKKVLKDECKYYICLFKYLEGRFLFESKLKYVQYKDIGILMGNLTKVLSHFSHSGGHRIFEWDIQNINIIHSNIKFVEGEERKNILYHHLNNVNNKRLPPLKKLRKSIIHNDGNDHNIILNKDGSLKGIIDFGDIIHSFTVLDAAVCMAYIGQKNKKPIESMKVFLEGYQTIFPLYEEEIFWLGQMICLRLCLSVTMSAWRKTIFPSNAYLTISEKSTWELLDYLKKLDIDSWYKYWIQNAK